MELGRQVGADQTELAEQVGGTDHTTEEVEGAKGAAKVEGVEAELPNSPAVKASAAKAEASVTTTQASADKVVAELVAKAANGVVNAGGTDSGGAERVNIGQGWHCGSTKASKCSTQ